MSNADESELKHNRKVTLYIDTFDSRQAIDITDKYPLAKRGVEQGGITYGEYPHPTRIQIEEDGNVWEERLYIANNLATSLDKLHDKINTVLQVAIVNDKQRIALLSLIDDHFRETLDSLYGI